MDTLNEKFEKIFGHPAKKEFLVYGRAELAGNHTDHQKGKVICATVNKKMTAVAAPNKEKQICVYSEGYGMIKVDLDRIDPLPGEKGRPSAIIRGMASKYPSVSGFDAYIVSEIPKGSGLSSSAAFEVLIGKIIEGLFKCPTNPTTLAQYAQNAENSYFGKPCGLMDQMAIAHGGIIEIDFGKDIPEVTAIDYDFNASDYVFCLINSGSSHARLTDLYAEIPEELGNVSHYFYKSTISEVDKRQFASVLPELREYAGDRAILRAMHVIEENFRVEEMVAQLQKGDFEGYLTNVNSSGNSSWSLLQNVIPSGSSKHQPLAFAIAITKFCLEHKGACRLMGGGFGGYLQAYVPKDKFAKFTVNVERILGKGSVVPVEFTKYE